MAETKLDDMETAEKEETSTAAKPKRVSFAHRLWTGEIRYDFVGHARWYYMFSAVLIIIAVGSFFLRGGLQFGIEFTGGSTFKVAVQAIDSATVGEYRSVVLGSGVDNLDPQVTTTGTNRVQIEVRALSPAEQTTLRQAIADKAGVEVKSVDYQEIGASWGKQITQRAIIAVVVFLVLVSLLMGIYFRDWKKSLAAITGLVHDMIITVGFYALSGLPVTPATLTGVLTILGYSLYDNVVVFDKVRENTADLDDYKWTYAEAANHSVNQVLVRSINTTVVGVLPVAAILFAGLVILGSGPLPDLGMALFVGMIIGAYSSIFIATPLLVALRSREPGMVLQAQRVAKRREKQAKAEASVQGTDTSSAASGFQTVTYTTYPEEKPATGKPAATKTASAKAKGKAADKSADKTTDKSSDKTAEPAVRQQPVKQPRAKRRS